MTLYTVNEKNFAVEIFLLYLRAPLHRKNIVREMSPCDFAFGGGFAMDLRRYFQPVVSSLATVAQSCLHSPLPHSRVFTSHCCAVMSSLATAAQSYLHSPLPRSRIFTRHCRAVMSSLVTAAQSCLHLPLPMVH